MILRSENLLNMEWTKGRIPTKDGYIDIELEKGNAPLFALPTPPCLFSNYQVDVVILNLRIFEGFGEINFRIFNFLCIFALHNIQIISMFCGINAKRKI